LQGLNNRKYFDCNVCNSLQSAGNFNGESSKQKMAFTQVPKVEATTGTYKTLYATTKNTRIEMATSLITYS
jgi:hypothetical protein